MYKHSEIRIERVGNGFIVTTPDSPSPAGSMLPSRCRFVAEDVESLVELIDMLVEQRNE